MSDVLMNPSMFSSGHVITAVAMGRWLNVSYMLISGPRKSRNQQHSRTNRTSSFV